MLTGLGTHPFAANFFIVAAAASCGTNNVNVNCLFSCYYSYVRQPVRSLDCG